MKQEILLGLLVFLSVLSHYVNAQEDKDCPSPTVCEDCDFEQGLVACNDKGLFTIPKPLPGWTKMLGLSGNQLRDLSADTFADANIETSLETLLLNDNQIETIAPGSFEKFVNLTDLGLFGNNLLSLNAGAFRGLKNLIKLDLSRNYLNNIGGEAFDGLHNLQLLQLWGNVIKTFALDAFVGLSSLSDLKLGENKMEKVPTHAFHALPNLTSLEMLNLPVRTLEAKAFASLVNLQKLHIGDWPELRLIDNEAFAGLKNLSYLSLYGCKLSKIPLEALRLLPQLQHLLLNDNPDIKRLGAGVFKSVRNLETLHLSKIGLKMIHERPFQLLAKLQLLDISENELKLLPNHIFFQLDNLKSLNLSYNRIKDMDELVLYPLKVLHDLDLSGNPIICDCDIKWLKRLHERKIQQQFGLMGKCHVPSKLNGTEIAALEPSLFICEKPSFAKEHKTATIYVHLGEPASLPCTPIQGLPPPEIKWQQLRGKQIKASGNQNTQPDGTLSIKKVSSADYGQYICLASNKLGNDSRTVMLVKAVSPAASGVTTGILVTLAIVVLLTAAGIYAYKRRAYVLFKNGLYDAMQYDNEEQRLYKSAKVN